MSTFTVSIRVKPGLLLWQLMPYPEGMADVLGSVRLSRLTDETTSPARQRADIENWCTLHSHNLIEVVTDLDVSGKVPPFDRPQLGPKLKQMDFDILVTSKLDRLSRGADDTYKLVQWAEDNNKTLVAIKDGLDTSTNWGRTFMRMAALFAEVERSSIQERVSSARVDMRQQGRWPAGRPPYGFRMVEKQFGDSIGYTLEEDKESADQLRQIIDQVISGISMVQIAKDLNERKVLTPRNYTRKPKDRTPGKWAPQSINNMLRSVSLLGQSTHKGEIIHDQGEPVQFGPALISWKTWKQLQDELKKRERPVDRPRDSESVLLGFAFCARCGSRLHLSWGGSGKYRRRTYRCVNYRDGTCTVGPMYKDNLEEFVEKELLAAVGNIELPDIEMIPGEDHTAELEQAEQSLKLLMADREKGMYRTKTTARVYEEKVAEYESVIERLEQAPIVDPQIKVNPSGKTVASVWRNGDVQEKRAALEKLPYICTVGEAAHKGSKDWYGRCSLDFFEEKGDLVIAAAQDAEERGYDDPESIQLIQWAQIVREANPLSRVAPASNEDQLRVAKSLLDKGIINQEQYDEAANRLK